MRHRFQLLFSSALIFAITSCKKAENKIFFEGGTPPQLAASTTAVVLEPGLESNVALILNWTNPDYKFTTGVSSQDVTYTLEMDTLGGKFSSNNKVTTVISKDTRKVYTVGELNGILGNTMALQLNPRRQDTLQVRVTSSISVSGGGTPAKLTSNVISFTATPFVPPPKVAPPSSGTLYITGSATAGDWMAAGDPELVSQKFTQVSSTVYEIVVKLTGKASYTFVPVYGDWGSKYSIKVKNDPNEIYGGDFQVGGEDIMAPPETADYKITVNFQSGKFTVVKQ